MNWVDIVIILFLTYYVYKGLRLGLVSALFSIASFLLSVFIAVRYYSSIYEFIINNEFFYKFFEKITEIILSLLFYSRIEENPDFLLKLISKGFIKFIISIVAIGLIFFLSNMVIKTILSIFSLVFRLPVFKGLNKIGGAIFGLAKGIFIVYFFNLIFNRLAVFFPASTLVEGIKNSLILTYLQTIDLFNLLLDFGKKKFI